MKEKLKRSFESTFRSFAVAVLALIAKLKFGAVGTCEEPKPEEGALILCNHACIWDFCFLLNALRPLHVRFVATDIEFGRNRLYAWVLRTLGVIPKSQGAVDAVCIRNVKRAMQSGECVAIYPHGMTSHDGRPAWKVMPGTGKMVRFMGAPVYTAIAQGSFLSHPRYAHRSYRGKVEVRIRRLLTAQEVAEQSAEEIQARIQDALTYNDWTWQENARVKYYKRKPIQGVLRTLYMCPDCKTVGGMEARNPNQLKCRICGMTAERDEYGFFHAVSGFCPTRMDEWVDLEIEKLKTEMQDPAFSLCAPVWLACPKKETGFEVRDEGTLTFSREGLTFAGKNQTLVWDSRMFQYFVMDDETYIHINATNGAYRFVFSDPRNVTRWFFAQRLMSIGM